MVDTSEMHELRNRIAKYVVECADEFNATLKRGDKRKKSLGWSRAASRLGVHVHALKSVCRGQRVMRMTLHKVQRAVETHLK
jgi:hypothetical protein